MNARILLSWAIFASPLAALPEMDWDKDLDAKTKTMLQQAMQLQADHPDIPYKNASASPEEGMDCSGAVSYILKQAGIEAPRSSAGQFAWLKDSPRFTRVPAEARDISHAVYRKLKPGDLIFWAADVADSDKAPFVSHVQMYLGKEKSDGLPVMVGSSDGRSYRGQKRNGYGIVDFHVPKVDSKTRIVGFGPPPFPGK